METDVTQKDINNKDNLDNKEPSENPQNPPLSTEKINSPANLLPTWNTLKLLWNTNKYQSVKELREEALKIFKNVPDLWKIKEVMERDRWTASLSSLNLEKEIEKTAAQIMDEKGVTIDRLINKTMEIVNSPDDISALVSEMHRLVNEPGMNWESKKDLIAVCRSLYDSRTKALTARLASIETLLKLRGAYPENKKTSMRISMNRSREESVKRTDDMTTEEMIAEIKRMDSAGITIDLTEE